MNNNELWALTPIQVAEHTGLSIQTVRALIKQSPEALQIATAIFDCSLRIKPLLN